MDFEQLKKQWQNQAARITALEAQNEELKRRLSVNSNFSRRDKLMRMYRTFIIIAIVMIPFSLFLLPRCGFSLLSAWIFASLFTCEGVGNSYIYYLLARLDFTTISTRTALRRVIKLQRSRSILQMVFIALTIPALVFIFYQMGSDNTPAIAGGITGGILGGIIGYYKDREIRRIIRLMLADLRELESEE